MSDDKPKVPDENEKVPDENDLLRQGKLSANPAQGAARVDLHVVDSKMRKIGEPSDVAAEKALLGSLLWAASFSPDSLRASQVADILPSGDPFYERAYGKIFDAMLACLVKNEETGHTPVEHDPVAVAQHASIMGNGSDKTGVDALLKLQNAASTVSEVQARAYAASIRATWAKREAIRDFRVIVADALSPRVTDAEIFERAQKASMEIMERSNAKASTISIKESAEQLFMDLKAPGGTPISTGLKELDAALNGGLRAPETSIVAARTNVGKSTISIGIAERVCSTDPLVGALYISMEMPHKSFTAKLLASRSRGVTVSKLRRKDLNGDQWSELTKSIAAVRDMELHFTVSQKQTLISAFAAASDRQRILRKAGKHLALVIIDHIGLVTPSSAVSKASRQQQVAETSRGLRWIASELGCHVMALAQVHRDAERQKPDAIPKLHHLRESGDIEQDADTIIILHRPRHPDSGVFVKDKPAALVVAKSRMDETAGMLVDFRDGRYVDWPDYDDRTFGSEYEGKDQDDHGKGAPFAPPTAKPSESTRKASPPDRVDDGHNETSNTAVPSVTTPIAVQTEMPYDGNAILQDRIVQYIVDAVTADISISDLRATLGQTKKMSVSTVENGIDAAVQRGLLVVSGDGDARTVRRTT